MRDWGSSDKRSVKFHHSMMLADMRNIQSSGIEGHNEWQSPTPLYPFAKAADGRFESAPRHWSR